VQVLSNGPACVITPAATPAGINLVASRLRITVETISQRDAEALIKEHRSRDHLYKVLASPLKKKHADFHWLYHGIHKSIPLIKVVSCKTTILTLSDMLIVLNRL